MSKLDIDIFLKPISKKNPCGKSILLDESFLQIKRERALPDNESLGVWKPTEKREIDWTKIEKLATEILTLKSKDLLISNTLLEARLHLYGLVGLSDSILLILNLSQKFWDQIFPNLEDEDARSNAFLWLSNKLPLFLKTIPLFEIPILHKSLMYSDIEKFIFKKEISENLKYLFSSSNNDYINFVVSEINKCSEAMENLNEFLSQNIFQNDKVLNKSLDILNIVVKIFQSMNQSHQLEEVEKPKENTEYEASFTEKNQTFEANRSEIYQELKRLSEMLLAIEPHSPVPLLILRSLRWESKSFIEIIFDIMKNSSDREGIMALFGKEENGMENNYGE